MLKHDEGKNNMLEHDEGTNVEIAVEKHENKDNNNAFSDNQCVICFNELNDGDMVGWSEHCDHIFHKDCIHSWLLKHPECPICRRNFLNLPHNDDEKNSTHAETEEFDIERGNSGEQGSSDERNRAISNNELPAVADVVEGDLDSAA